MRFGHAATASVVSAGSESVAWLTSSSTTVPVSSRVMAGLPGANLGFGRAVNLGVAATSGPVIVLVNNDLFVEPDFVAQLTSPLSEDGIGMASGLTLLPGEGAQRIDGAGMHLDRTLCVFNGGRGRPAEDAPRLSPPLPSGGCVALLRAAFVQVGGFDELLFAYGEDADLGTTTRQRWVAVRVRSPRERCSPGRREHP